MSKLLPILNVAFAALALIVSIVVLLQVMGIKSAIANPEDAQAQNVDPSAIPLSQLEEFQLEDQFMLTYPKEEDPSESTTVLFSLGFAINIEDENAQAARDALTGQGKIIQDNLNTWLLTKDASYFRNADLQAELKTEIVERVNTLVGNQAIVNVFFKGMIIRD